MRNDIKTDRNLVFLDIDGTLLDTSYHMNDSRLPALIRSLQETRNYIFGLNSNRSLEDILPIAQLFSIEGPLIGENGIMAYFPATRQTDFFLPQATLAGLQKQKADLETILYQTLKEYFTVRRVIWEDLDTVRAISQQTITPTYKEGDIIVLNNVYRKYTISAHLFEFKSGKLEILEASSVEDILLKIKAQYSEMTITYDSKFSNILAYSPQVSKRSAIEQVISSYAGSRLYSIGDEISDYLMTSHIGTFLAVQNASSEAKLKAGFVSEEMGAKGVRELLVKITGLANE